MKLTPCSKLHMILSAFVHQCLGWISLSLVDEAWIFLVQLNLKRHSPLNCAKDQHSGDLSSVHLFVPGRRASPVILPLFTSYLVVFATFHQQSSASLGILCKIFILMYFISILAQWFPSLESNSRKQKQI